MIESYINSDNQTILKQQELLSSINKKNKSIAIGVPKEVTLQENRICITPSSVEILVNNGHSVYIESGAGSMSHFHDSTYLEKGAKIVYDRESIFKADIILKVSPPTLDEINLMKPNVILFSSLHIPIISSKIIKALLDKKINCIAYEFLQDDDGSLPIVRSISEIAGNTVVSIASKLLSEKKNMMLGGVTGIPPANVVIIGAGTICEAATRNLLSLGCSIKVFDTSLYRLRRLQKTFNQHIYTTLVQPKLLTNALKECDVAIGAIRPEKRGISPCIVSEDMVMSMKQNSIIIDVCIDNGGCFETSKTTNLNKDTFEIHGITHYCVPNITSTVSRTASYALTNILTPIILDFGKLGGFDNVISQKYGIKQGTYIYKGILTSKYLSEQFSIPYTDIDLLLTTSSS